MYKIHTEAEAATLILSGDVDLQTTADLKSEIAELHAVATLDIQAGGVSYIDSSGVAVLLMTRQHCLANGIEMSISVASQPVQRVLQIAKLDKLLPISKIVDTHDVGADNFGIGENKNPSSQSDSS